MTARALVVGGAGFVGSHTVSELIGDGFEVAVLDRIAAADVRTGDLIGQCEYFEGSVASKRDIEGVCGATNPDVILNVASFGAGGRGLVASGEIDPERATMINVVGLVNTLETARSGGARVVWASSTTVYAPADRYPGVVDEQALVGPRSTYAATKVLGEQLVRTYREQHGVEGIAIRPTLVWGPGVQYRGVQSALGDMVEAAATGDSVTVPAGDEPWDLIYVKDAARAFAAMARAESVPPVVTVTGYVASIDQVREEVLSQMSEAAIAVEGVAPRLGFPLVDTGAARESGFLPEYDLSQSVTDYLSIADS